MGADLMLKSGLGMRNYPNCKPLTSCLFAPTNESLINPAEPECGNQTRNLLRKGTDEVGEK